METTEYGAPRPTENADGTLVDNSTGTRYAWLGGKQRAADTPAGLSLMGVRLHNPTTGRFLQTDPIYGGNANTYSYPNDPLTMYDLDGRHCVFGRTWGRRTGGRCRNPLNGFGRAFGRGSRWGGYGLVGGAVTGCAVGAFAAGGVGCWPGAVAGGGAGGVGGALLGFGSSMGGDVLRIGYSSVGNSWRFVKRNTWGRKKKATAYSYRPCYRANRRWF